LGFIPYILEAHRSLHNFPVLWNPILHWLYKEEVFVFGNQTFNKVANGLSPDELAAQWTVVGIWSSFHLGVDLWGEQPITILVDPHPASALKHRFIHLSIGLLCPKSLANGAILLIFLLFIA